MKDTSVIPNGIYCYDENGKCPYWSLREDLPEQYNGFCDFLGNLYSIKCHHVFPVARVDMQIVRETRLQEPDRIGARATANLRSSGNPQVL